VTRRHGIQKLTPCQQPQHKLAVREVPNGENALLAGRAPRILAMRLGHNCVVSHHCLNRPSGKKMVMRSVPAEALRFKPLLTRNQVRSFWAAWGGWTMDGMDSFIYSLVLVPALRDLLPRSGIPATTANIGYYGGLLFALFMVGWGMALFWGPIADRFGRVRTMMFSISCFSLFTLLAAFATGIWSPAIFRFLAGVGIGGEWSIGASFVSEDWPEERRTMGGALMHTGYYVGFFLLPWPTTSLAAASVGDTCSSWAERRRSLWLSYATMSRSRFAGRTNGSSSAGIEGCTMPSSSFFPRDTAAGQSSIRFI
jgi:hypothetical protein